MAQQKGASRKVKGKLPTKIVINLVYREKDTGHVLFALLAFVVFLLALAAFTKFLVLDQLKKIDAAQEAYSSLQNQYTALQKANEDYESVENEYSHFGTGFFTADELALTDREELLAVINDKISIGKGMSQIQVSGNTATVQLMSSNMREISQIVAELESSPIVQYVGVDTAVTQAVQSASASALQKKDDTVNAAVTIEFRSPLGADTGGESESGESLTDQLAASKEAAEATGVE